MDKNSLKLNFIAVGINYIIQIRKNMKKILFIEDEEALHKTLGAKLVEQGYSLELATDGLAGMEKVKTFKPDLIILDLILPKMNGFDFLEMIKQDPDLKKIPIIVLTNLEASNDVQKAIELGATTYLVKSNYSLDEVSEKIKLAIENNNK